MKLTLKQKLIASAAVGVVLMAALLTTLAAQQLNKQTLNGLTARTHSLVDTAAAGVTDWIAIRAEITNAMRGYTSDTATIVPHLQQARLSAGFDDIYYGTADGRMYRSHPERNRADYDPRQRPWYQQAASARKQVITDAYRDAITNAMLVTIAEPVIENGRVVGVIGADVLIDQLINDVISLDAGHNAFAMMVTRDGMVVAHPDQDSTNKMLTRYNSNLSTSAINDITRNHAFSVKQRDGVDKLYYFAPVEGTDWLLGVEMDYETEFSSHSELLFGLLATSAVVTLVLVATLAWLVSYLFRDLIRVSDALEDIANGEGDLTQRITPNSDDEVGKLAQNFNTFVGNMHAMVSRLRDVADNLDGQAKITAGQATGRQERINRQQDEINMVATAINEMAAATQEIAGNAENTAKQAEEAVGCASHGAAQVSNSQQSISNLSCEVENATGVIAELNQHSQNISSILATIRDIAEQTNLLALNAAIEAARAGEQGRGFAVVADEVRVLSQRTHASTQEIQSMIETLQATTENAVRIMDDSRNLAGTSVDDANMAAASLNQINVAVTSISDMATQIASAAEQQSLVTQEITRNTDGIRDVSDLLATEANEAAQQAGELSDLSRQLQSEINQFRL